MAALAAVMLDDPHFPHGTPQGFSKGCKSARSCPELLSCKEANAAARHDYKVARLFKDGASPAQVAAYLSDGIAPVLTPAPDGAPASKPQDAKEHTVPTNDTPTPKPHPKAPKPRPVPDVGTPAAIRAWAREQGFEVGSRGTIQPIIVQKYNEAHGLAPAPDAADEAPQPAPEAAEPTPEDAAAAGTEIASGGITVALAAAETDAPEAYVPVQPGANHVTWSEVVDIARRSDMLDETRERIGEPVDDDTAFRQAAADAATRPEWADVAAAAEIAAATRRAEQAEQLAARTLTALELALQKWQEATARADAAKALAADAAKALTTDALGNRDRVHACNVRIAELEAELARARRPWFRFGGAR